MMGWPQRSVEPILYSSSDRASVNRVQVRVVRRGARSGYSRVTVELAIAARLWEVNSVFNQFTEQFSIWWLGIYSQKKLECDQGLNVSHHG